MKNPPKRLWILIDVSNSSGDGVKNYCRFFLTRADAREYRDEQNSNPDFARLEGPFRYELLE